jgi:hypothetical protein
VFLFHPPESDTLQLHQNHRRPSQSRAFNTGAVKVTDVVGERSSQGVLTEFLIAYSSPIEIHRRLSRVYDEDVINISSFRRWIRHFKSGEKGTGDRPCSGRPDKAATMGPKRSRCADSG